MEQRTKDNIIYSICYRVSNNDLFKVLSSTAIALNALILGLGRAGISEEEESKLE